MTSIDEILQTLNRLPVKDYDRFLEIPFEDFFWKKPTALTRCLVKDVFSIREPRLLTIVGHLYFDFIMHVILQEYGTGTLRQRQGSYSRRLKTIESQSLLQTDICKSLWEINELRNEFGHNLFYDFSEWDAQRLPLIKKGLFRLPKQRNRRVAFNTIVLRLAFFYLAAEIFMQQSCLLWVKGPRIPLRVHRLSHGTNKIWTRTG